MSEFVFYTTCVNSTAERIDEMTDIAQDLSCHQFIYRIAKAHAFDQDLLSRLGYEQWGQQADRSPRALFVDDYAKSCHQSFYLGFPCFYVRWSAIEHVYVRSDDVSLIRAMESKEQSRSALIDELETQWDQLEHHAVMLDVPVIKAAEKFIEAAASTLVEYRIPTLRFMNSNLNVGLERFLRDKDSANLS